MRQPSRLISANDFAAMFSAAEFAAQFELWCDTSVTLVWGLMGANTDAEISRLYNNFQKCLRDWLDKRVLPQAWLYSHECGQKVGLHTHMIVFLPGAPCSYRDEFRKWVRNWTERQIGGRVPRAVRVRGPKIETPMLHWLLTGYLLKGFDKAEAVQSARNSPDGQPVFLGDLIPWPWTDPGPVTLKQRVGWSRSLGPECRARGVPASLSYLLKSNRIVPDGPIGLKAIHQPIAGQGFRSKFEDGIRDVRFLYPPDFCQMITGREPWPADPGERDDEGLDEFIASLNT